MDSGIDDLEVVIPARPPRRFALLPVGGVAKRNIDTLLSHAVKEDWHRRVAIQAAAIRVELIQSAWVCR